MTSQSPRIYTYKITFEEVPYYYYGVKREKYYNQEYWGTPVTHKWCWDFYTPKKQILEFFEYSDVGWLNAQKVEQRLIKPVYNTDKWCLNETCGGLYSLSVLRKNYQLGIGIHSLTKEERIEVARKGGKKAYEMSVGVHALSKSEKSEIGKRGGKTAYENKVGIHARTQEEKILHNIKAGKRSYELRSGVHSMTHEEKVQSGKLTYELGVGVHALTSKERSDYGKIGGEKTSSQIWKCTITGYETNAGGLFIYQRNRGIDTSNRIRIK